uniref:Uncharacterized protein n=1 Tax=Leersia perrieri TaxID=77586 RepID=A0A0D9VII8_9ORYZ
MAARGGAGQPMTARDAADPARGWAVDFAHVGRVKVNVDFAPASVEFVASATRALAKGTTFEDVISMVKEVIPGLSCPAALFT